MKSDFEQTLKDLQELNAEKVSSYIILVKEDTPKDEHSSKGLNAVYGTKVSLSNLLANLDPRILQDFLILHTVNSLLKEEDNDK